ncbi:MAG: M16 family metallopeptidase [Candidatus Hinthialibacter sp.]
MTSNSAAIHIPKREVIREMLANGAVLLYAPNPYNQIIAIRIFSRLASRHESADQAGMANLCMRLLSAGTEQHSEEQIAEILERNGAHFKAEAGKDYSSVNLLTTTHFLRDDLQIVLELIDGPVFLEDKLAREREVVRMNILEQEDSRLQYTMRVFRQKYYGSHPYAWPSIGLIQTLDAVQRGDLTGFAQGAFDPSNLVVSVVGGAEQSDTLSLIRDSLAQRSRREGFVIPDSPIAQSAVSNDVDVIERRESEAEYLVMGYPGCGVADEDAAPLAVISTLLGGSMDSRLFREIRDKRGLCYQVGSSFSPQRDHSPLLVYIVTSPQNRREAVDCTQAEIETLKTESVSADELERVKTYLCGVYVMSLESNMGQASCYGAYEINGLGWEYANRFTEKIAAVTPEDVMKTAQTYFTHRLLAITAPPAD